MTQLIRTYRYRLYPTILQSADLNRQIDSACLLYNAALQERRDAWRLANKSIGLYEQDRQLKDIRGDGSLDIPNFDAARDVLRRVDRAFVAFFRRLKAGKKPGYPRFRDSFRADCR